MRSDLTFWWELVVFHFVVCCLEILEFSFSSHLLDFLDPEKANVESETYYKYFSISVKNPNISPTNKHTFSSEYMPKNIGHDLKLKSISNIGTLPLLYIDPVKMVIRTLEIQILNGGGDAKGEERGRILPVCQILREGNTFIEVLNHQPPPILA